jgi:hypothetical protein
MEINYLFYRKLWVASSNPTSALRFFYVSIKGGYNDIYSSRPMVAPRGYFSFTRRQYVKRKTGTDC